MEEKLKYKKREETNCIRVHFEPESKTTKQIYIDQRKSGLFNIGYHYILQENGLLDVGIPFYAYADYRFKHTEDSLYLLVVGCRDQEGMTSSQIKALDDFSHEKNLKIIYEE